MSTVEPEPNPGQAETPLETPGRERVPVARLAAWAVVALALLGWLALGSVATVTWRYNAITNRVFRQETTRDLVAIWRGWLDDLPGGSGWMLEAVFVGSIAVVLLTAIAGTWLLLVASDAATARARRR